MSSIPCVIVSIARDWVLLETWLQFVAILIISPFLTKKNYIEGWENPSGNMNPIRYINSEIGFSGAPPN